MPKRSTLIILLLLAVLGGLSYHFVNWATGDKHAEAVSVDGSEAETEETPGGGDAVLEQALAEKGLASGALEGASAAAGEAEVESAVKLATPAQSGQSRIMKLIEGAKLLDEATVAGVKGEKTIRVYDVGDRFKYPMVRVETLIAEDGAGPMTAMVADHLIVRVKDPKASLGEVREWMQGMGLMVRKAMHTAGHFLVSPGLDNKERFSFLLESLQKRLGSAVEVAEPDFIVFTTANLPNDDNFNRLWGMHNTGQNFGLADADIDAPEAWDKTTGSRAIKVAVIDTGVDYNHPDLAANIWINPNEIAGDGIDNDGNGFIDDVRGWDFHDNENNPMDIEGHGTHCAGTIGGVGNNSIGVAGVNWEVSIVPIRFLGPYGGSISDAIDSVNYATGIGVHLSSNSWGGGGYSELLKSAIAAAGEANQLFVAAAGNDGQNIETGDNYPSGYTFDDAIDNVIAVASVDRNDNISYFSNYAVTKVDLGAPGSAIYSTTPGNNYSTYSGTSMATPHVAGACALYLSISYDTEFQRIKQDLLETVVPIAALNGKCRTGGRLNLNDFIMRADGSSVSVQSIATTGSVGFPNYFSPGETITIHPVYRNSSNASVHSVVSSLSTRTSGVSIGVSRIDLGNMGAGEEVEPETAFSITIPESFYAPGVIDLEIKTVSGASDESIRSLQLQVCNEVEVTGTVSDAGTGAGVAGATLLLSGQLDAETMSDASGHYSFWTIDGEYSLKVSKPGYAGQKRDFIFPSSGPFDFVLTQPQLGVDLQAVNLELSQGESREINLALSNRGNGTLEWALDRRGVLLPDGEVTYTHHTNVPYRWNDISNVGTLIELVDDNNLGPFPLGFDFFFFEQEFDSIRVCSNGFLSFTNAAAPYINRSLDHQNVPENMIAFFWDDLHFLNAQSAAYYYRNEAGQMVFQFDNAEFYDEPGALFSAQVILSPDFSTQIHYKEIGRLGSASIGLRGSDRSEFYQVSYNDDFGSNESTLTIEPSLLGRVLGETSGTLTTNDHDLRLRIDASNLAPGTYQDYLIIKTNEGTGNVHRIPVTINVLDNAVLGIVSQEYQEQAGLGDGDSVPEAGETLNFNLILENTGTKDSQQVATKISGGDALVELLESESLYGPIALGEKAANETPFVIRINPAAPFGHEADFQLKLFDSTGEEISSKAFVVKVLYQEQVNGSVKIYGINKPLPGALVRVGEKTVLADAQGQFSFSFDTPGSYMVAVGASGFIGQEKEITLPYADSLDFALMNPTLEVNPKAYSSVVYQGDLTTGSIRLSNQGHGPLDWEITSGNTLNFLDGDYELSMETPYVWNDISTIGERVFLWDDNSRGPYEIGFPFKLYGKAFSQIRVCSNGFLNFGEERADYNNEPLNSPTAPDNLIAFFWDDLYFGTDSKAFIHRIDNQQCIVQFDNAGYYADRSSRLSVQVVLKSDHSITIYYKRVDIANSATIGIRGNYSKDPTAYKQVAYNESVVRAGSALTLKPNSHPYGAITSALSGTINQAAASINFTIDSSELPPGCYRDGIVLKTNQAGKNWRTIPIELRVYRNSLYEQFLERHKVPRLKWGVLEDDDCDGWSNLLEFAFGLNPASSEGAPGLNLLSIVSTASNGNLAVQNVPANQNVLNFEYRRRTDAAGLDYLLQHCEDLRGEWQTIESPSETTRATSDANIEEVQVSIPLDSTKPKRFYRIEVVPR